MKFRILDDGIFLILATKVKSKWIPCCADGYLLAECVVFKSWIINKIQIHKTDFVIDMDRKDWKEKYKKDVTERFKTEKEEWIEKRKEVEAKHKKIDQANEKKNIIRKVVIDI